MYKNTYECMTTFATQPHNDTCILCKPGTFQKLVTGTFTWKVLGKPCSNFHWVLML